MYHKCTKEKRNKKEEPKRRKEAKEEKIRRNKKRNKEIYVIYKALAPKKTKIKKVPPIG